MNLTAAQKAYAKLKAAGATGVLVGTAALQLRGYMLNAPDLDFLCDISPVPEAERSESGGNTVEVDGVKVDYIVADGGRQEFLHPERAMVIAGILVAAEEDALGLKRFAGRPKDKDFLAQFASIQKCG